MNSGQCPVESGLGMGGATLSHMSHKSRLSMLKMFSHSGNTLLGIDEVWCLGSGLEG